MQVITMRQRKLTPMAAIRHMKKMYEEGKLTNQVGDFSAYWCRTTQAPCIVGSLYVFTEEEKTKGVSGIGSGGRSTGLYLARGVANVCGIDSSDLVCLQHAHDKSDWPKLEKGLATLKAKYSKRKQLIM